MTQQIINVGSAPNDGTGDSAYSAFTKTNANFTDLYTNKLASPQSAAEAAAGVTPSSYLYPVGDIRRYGAALNGSTDDTTAVQNWAKVGGNLTWPVPQTALVSTTILLVSNTTITSVQGGGLTCNSAAPFSVLSATGKSNILINGFSITNTTQSTSNLAAYLGFVLLTTCTNCRIVNCNFTGHQMTGVVLDNCAYCIVRDCVFLSMLYYGYGVTTPSNANCQNESGDIALYGLTGVNQYCQVLNNTCYGGGCFGIALQNVYSGPSGGFPTHCTVTGNKVGGGNLQYGILVYSGSYGSYINSYNVISQNDIQNVAGSYQTNPGGGLGAYGGAGIYAVGTAIGGITITSNTINNCCINTTTRGLAPAAIGINGVVGLQGLVPPIVANNAISGMTRYDGIEIVSSTAGALVSGNSINMPASNTTGAGIRVDAANGVNVTGNNITLLNNLDGILLFAETNNMGYTTIANNTIIGGANTSGAAQIRVTGSSFQNLNLVINGNSLSNAGASGSAVIYIVSGELTTGIINNNMTYGAACPALIVAADAGIRVSGNSFNTSAANGVTLSGTCTGSFFDKTNLFSGTMVNTATGFVVHQLTSAAPSTGNAVVGDTAYNTAPTATGTFAWSCTTSGNPGTWTALVIP